MIRWLTSLISIPRMNRSERERNSAARQSQLLEGLPHMSSRSQKFVETSLAAWDQLPEADRNLPSSF